MGQKRQVDKFRFYLPHFNSQKIVNEHILKLLLRGTDGDHKR